MATANFEELVKGVCELVGEAPPELPEDGLRGFSVTLKEVEVNIIHDPERNPRCAFVVTTFGDLPQQRELQALHALMEANYRMSINGGGAFSCDHASAKILFQYAFPFDDGATALDLYQGMLAVAEHGHSWRKDHLLAMPDPVPQPGTAIRA